MPIIRLLKADSFFRNSFAHRNVSIGVEKLNHKIEKDEKEGSEWLKSDMRVRNVICKSKTQSFPTKCINIIIMENHVHYGSMNCVDEFQRCIVLKHMFHVSRCGFVDKIRTEAKKWKRERERKKSVKYAHESVKQLL